MNDIIQLSILVTSGLAIWLSTSDIPKRKKLGAFCGIGSQVFWLKNTLEHNQWGMFLLSIWYLIIFIRILINESYTSKHRKSARAYTK
jgi:hypothetical protein